METVQPTNDPPPDPNHEQLVSKPVGSPEDSIGMVLVQPPLNVSNLSTGEIISLLNNVPEENTFEGGVLVFDYDDYGEVKITEPNFSQETFDKYGGIVVQNGGFPKTFFTEKTLSNRSSK